MEFILPDHLLLAVILSLLLNIFIAIAGVVPSTFLTAANILYFGFKYGLVMSIIGEALGAVISFFLYRRGVKVLEAKVNLKRSSRLIEKLKKTNGGEGVLLVIGLRIFPFVPSGLVTLAASISQMKLVTFAIVSTLGKVPALFIEAYSIHTMINMKTEYQIALALFVVFLVLCYFFIKKAKNRIS